MFKQADPTTARPVPLDPRQQLWIGGASSAGHADRWAPNLDPSTGRTICEVARATAADVDRAVAAARAALPAWAALPPVQRGRILHDVGRRMLAIEDELAFLETLDTGKPLRQARQDVQRTAEAFEFYAGLADKLFGATIPAAPEFLNYTVREPVGVTAHITPWNFPLRLAMRSVAPALAAGNTVVVKPAEQAPLTCLRAGPLLAEAGVPAGVFNVLPGPGGEAGAALAGHPGVNHVAFTGSVPTGIAVMKAAAENVVPVTLELGGKSPNIVFADADLDAALHGAAKAIFTNAGQVCMAGSRLLLDESIAEEFLRRLVDRARGLRLGPGIDDPDMGPLISEEQRTGVLAHVERAVRDGAHVLTGGGMPCDAACASGFFVEPTIVEARGTAPIAHDEVFGPVLTVLRFRTEEEAIRIANDSQYGLVAGVWTASLDRAHRVAARIEAGQIYVNDFFLGSTGCPFGGYKKSGFGRERGVEVLNHYTQTKAVCIRLRA